MYATIIEEYATYTTGGFKEVKFNRFSSKLLSPELITSMDMDMKIIIYLKSYERLIPLVKLVIAGETAL